MNTEKRIKNLYSLAPEYPRIPHLDKKISNMTHDDIQIEDKIQFPITGWVQEKLDGANLGVSWTSGPVIRNRNNILKKGYIKKETPANEWLAPDKFESEMSQTNINFIKPELKIFNDISDVVRESEKPSNYRNGIREGIVIKLSDERKVVSSFKIVNKYFDRREDFNQELIRNSLIKK